MFPSFIIPLFVLLIAYIAFLLFYLACGFLSIRQLIQLGVPGPAMTISLITFASVTLAIIIGSLFLLATYDWSAAITIGNIIDSEASPFLNGL